MVEQQDKFIILITDDRKENIISLEEILAADNRIFLRATSGNEALKQVVKNENIGLIMLDVQMPGMDGFEVAKLLKGNPNTKDISIIFVTASNKEEQYILKGFEHGAVDYLQKPLNISLTQAKVNVFERLYLYQQNLRKTFHDLEIVNKQLERFVYVVSHDLKSPLSSIITILSLLEKNDCINSDSYLQSRIEMLSQSSNHLSEMINSILDYSKKTISQQSSEEVDVYELVQEIAYLLFPPQNIKINISPDLPVIKTQKIKLQQVFQNLLSNAIKFNDKPESIIEVGVNDKGKFYEFFIRDNGRGISEEDREKIFKLFQTTGAKPTGETSTGVGLFIIKMAIEEQGGTIRIESKEGEGSTFYFEWKK
ncbi:MAG TPA: hybrid sensor histidine kinase/response regulator [Chitinophagaceae bacterium]|nr:hybrid sensor histidine kinase/response regulator [Chitinophagaceae bacterium]